MGPLRPPAPPRNLGGSAHQTPRENRGKCGGPLCPLGPLGSYGADSGPDSDAPGAPWDPWDQGPEPGTLGTRACDPWDQVPGPGTNGF